MKEKNLLRKLSALGFPLFETEEAQDVNQTLTEVVKSKELRLWEGFPVVLAKSAEMGLFNYEMAKRYLKKPVDKTCLDSLMILSLALYKSLNLKFSWADKFYKSLSVEEKKKFNDLLRKLKKDENFKITHYQMSSQRLKSTFNNYFNQTESRLGNLLSVKEELSLEYALSQIFSPKQKELFLKKLKRERLTKTETEYYSRVVKKKVLALANLELHRLARRLIE
jgi:hypothetical protein